MRWWIYLVAVALVACGDDDGDAHDAAAPDGPPTVDAAVPDAVPDIPTDLARDIVATDLVLDLGSMMGAAVIDVAASPTSSVSFEAQGLTITDVDKPWELAGDVLDVAAGPDATTVTIEYTFATQSAFDGYLANGLTFLWPYFCGNLFPCHSSPADGTTFTLAVSGVPGGEVAVFPAVIPAAAPSYMLALAIGDYTETILGTTTASTSVSVWSLPGDPAGTAAATEKLRNIFDWFETTYGAYTFGARVGSVSALWGPGAYGGMEHHPFWHVASAAMDDEVTHAHEAAHGWFGNGVRIRCWEDFVLSEGTVTYLAARGIEAVRDAAAGQAVWQDYQAELDLAVANGDTIAYPSGCDAIDILNDPLWSSIPYMKGAFFYRAVEQQVGRPALDAVIAAFYVAHVGSAASMQDMLDLIQGMTGFDPTALADGWLRNLGTLPR